MLRRWARANRVRSFPADTEHLGMLTPHTIGPRTVPVKKIVGSVGRGCELRSNFMPIRASRAEALRYRRILEAMDAGVTLPPVELYKLGTQYYALDGNHRVAAALQRGQLEIDALVVEFVPVGDEAAQRTFRERRSFEHLTALNLVDGAQPGTYPRLEHFIRRYAQDHGMDLRDAARRWYSLIYLPGIAELPAGALEKQFPAMEIADWFVEVEDERRWMERTLERRVSIEQAVQRVLRHHGIKLRSRRTITVRRSAPDVLHGVPLQGRTLL